MESKWCFLLKTKCCFLQAIFWHLLGNKLDGAFARQQKGTHVARYLQQELMKALQSRENTVQHQACWENILGILFAARHLLRLWVQSDSCHEHWR